MKITTKIQTEYDQTIALKCDICGKTYDDIFEIQEFLLIDFVGGYGSIFGDGDTVECEICQYCLKDIIGKICRIKGQYDNYFSKLEKHE